MRLRVASLTMITMIGIALPATAETPTPANTTSPDVKRGDPLAPDLATDASIKESVRDIILTVESTQDSSTDVTSPTKRQLTLAADVLFAFGKADLAPAAAARLDEIAASAKDGDIRSVTVEGYTDSVGEDAANLALSRRRAEAVRAALAPLLPAGTRFSSVGRGEANPLVPNTKKGGGDDPAARAKNRRVVVTVLR